MKEYVVTYTEKTSYNVDKFSGTKIMNAKQIRELLNSSEVTITLMVELE